MKYGTQSQAGSAHSPVTLFGNTKRDRSFPPPSVWRRSKNTNYPKCWKGLPLSQCPMSLGWLGHKAKQQNTNYPNPQLWLVRRRHKMNIWLKCYSVKRRGDHLLMNLINVPAISSVAVYYFHRLSFVGVLSVHVLCDIFHLSSSQCRHVQVSLLLLSPRVKCVAMFLSDDVPGQPPYSGNFKVLGESVVKAMGLRLLWDDSFPIEPLLRGVTSTQTPILWILWGSISIWDDTTQTTFILPRRRWRIFHRKCLPFSNATQHSIQTCVSVQRAVANFGLPPCSWANPPLAEGKIKIEG